MHNPHFCVRVGRELGCVAGIAYRLDDLLQKTYTSHTSCQDPDPRVELPCAAGCAVEASVYATGMDAVPFPEVTLAMLCAETREVQLGDFCPATGCLPTRAHVEPDGTVTQTYLACSTYKCQRASAPVIEGYLQPCGPLGALPPASGVRVKLGDDLAACLVVYDATTQQYRTGKTRRCIGDWQCPAGALCDDALMVLDDPSEPAAVCKPGPRGVLTADTLALP